MPASLPFAISAIAGSALISICLIVTLRPLLARYAMARPNARSSHTRPTPQGGGIAIVMATVITSLLASFWIQRGVDTKLLVVLVAAIALGIVGAIDDIRPLRPETRLLLQGLAVLAVIATLPSDVQIFPYLPFAVERFILIVSGIWFVNLVNFMDGIDLMTVSEIVPITATIGVFGILGFVPVDASIVAITLLGAMLGFAPFNVPRAKLFMGDVGSLPIGLVVGWLLSQLAFGGHLMAAILLPLYYLSDATITLLCRLVRGEHAFEAHRDHYYQRAYDSGRTVYWIVSRIFLANIALAGVLLWTIESPAPVSTIFVGAAGVVIVGLLLLAFKHSSSNNNSGTKSVR